MRDFSLLLFTIKFFQNALIVNFQQGTIAL